MKKASRFGALDLIAKNNGYNDKIELLRDYGFIPTVKMPAHKKIEIVSLLWKHYVKRRRQF